MNIIDTDAHPPCGEAEVDHLGRLSPHRFFERLQRAGIDTAVGTLPLPSSLCTTASTAEDTLRTVNDAALSLAKIYPRNYLPGIHIHPAHPTLSCREIEIYSNAGVRMIGEIRAEWLDCPPDQSPLTDIFSCAEQYGMTVSVHSAAPERLGQWAKRFPGLNFMYGSRQCNISLAASADLLQKHTNLYLRLSQNIFLANYYLHTYVEKLPTSQLLFASGYPFCNPAARIAAVQWELRDQSEAKRQRIFRENAINCLDNRHDDTVHNH